MINLGKDNCALFPTVLQITDGVCISKSNITGNYILSGRASASSEDALMDNRTIMCHNTNLEKTVDVQTSLSVSSRNYVQMLLPGASGKSDVSKKILTEITTDSINVPPVKRCVKCVGCKNCKKAHLPDQARQLARLT